MLSDGDLFWITNGFDFGGSRSSSSSGGGPNHNAGCGCFLLCIVGFAIFMVVIMIGDLVDSCSSNHHQDCVDPDSIPYTELVPDTLLDTISAEPAELVEPPTKQTANPGKSTSSKSNIYYYEVEGNDDEYDEEEEDEDEEDRDDDSQVDDDYDEDYDDVDAEDYD